ncbi:hypothetical protein H6P81_012996 [Aristolochia fimbriata]|uniref:Uncharacterized protein n=1 Tax=Aristolochia fimbriata TaxID=158543 RepID=A0AAV7EI24_ARIFI|nr:hypothetical protein H6P81_012996 [Aristolochia fimbriata]
MKGISSTGGGRRKTTVGPPTSKPTRKDRDEDLLLFHEMLRRERERTLSLLQPVISDEFDANPGGNYSMYKLIPSGKKGGPGLELLNTGNDKNDYDWLKTPPATPLFPSLEMEATGPQLAIQRDIHIVLPVKYSRFSGKSAEASKSSNAHDGTKSPATKPVSLVSGDKGRPEATDLSRSAKTDRARNARDQYSKPGSRGVSPVVRSRTPSTIFPGILFSDDTPPKNLRTALSERSTSATRGRGSVSSSNTKPERVAVVVNPRRQSCSPTVSRGSMMKVHDKDQKDKGQGRLSNNGGAFLGSRMVEKVMNARKSVAGDEKEPKPRFRVVSGGDGTGFGRMLSKSSLDMADLKHMDMKGASTNYPIFHNRTAKNSTRRGNCGEGSADQEDSNPGQGKEEEEEEAQMEKIRGK